MARALPRQWARRGLALLAGLVWVLCGTHCLYLAPLEEEVPEPDEPPWIDSLEAVEPRLGERPVDLSSGPFLTFAVHRVQDVNAGQTLYWRWVVNYSAFAYASVPEPIAPEQRDTDPVFQFRYQPCGDPHRVYVEDRNDSNHILVLAISDTPFDSPQQFFYEPDDDVRVERALATDPPGRATLVQWWLQMSNACP